LPLPPGIAEARHTRGDWIGAAEQGFEIRLRVTRGEPRFMRSFDVELNFQCDEGHSTEEFFLGPGSPCEIVNGYVEDTFKNGDLWRLTWTASFRHDRVTGTVRFEANVFEGLGHELHNCDSGGWDGTPRLG
jgi:hypothetical protein